MATTTMTPIQKMRAVMADKIAEIEKRKAPIAAAFAAEAAFLRRHDDDYIEREYDEFERDYYDGLREAYNVAGDEMLDFYKEFKKLGCDHSKFVDYLYDNDSTIYMKEIIKAYWR